MYRLTENVSHSRPKGRAPKGKAWCKVKGEWIDETFIDNTLSSPSHSVAKPTVSTEDISHSRPKGRAPKGKIWSKDTGEWIDKTEEGESSNSNDDESGYDESQLKDVESA